MVSAGLPIDLCCFSQLAYFDFRKIAPMAPLQFSFGSSSAVSTALATMNKQREQSTPATSLKAVASGVSANVVAASAAEGSSIKLYTPAYYWACAAGGVASCGLTHMGVTPLDVVKCNMQTDPKKYSGIVTGG